MKENYDFSNGTRGAVVNAKRKTRFIMSLDNDVLTAYREQAHKTGVFYQTLINDTLRAAIKAQLTGGL